MLEKREKKVEQENFIFLRQKEKRHLYVMKIFGCVSDIEYASPITHRPFRSYNLHPLIL